MPRAPMHRLDYVQFETAICESLVKFGLPNEIGVLVCELLFSCFKCAHMSRYQRYTWVAKCLLCANWTRTCWCQYCITCTHTYCDKHMNLCYNCNEKVCDNCEYFMFKKPICAACCHEVIKSLSQDEVFDNFDLVYYRE